MLDTSQQQALDNISQLNNNIYILTGGPGRGKTFSVIQIYKMLIKKYKEFDIYFCTPTGKSAQVLSDVLSDLNVPHTPQTIHRMLGCQGKRWIYNRDNPLSAKFVIVDESSMIDSELMARLFTSVSPDCKFLLVGDADQLFPVGAGCPFLDIIKINHNNCVNTLAINHRAAEGGMIAHATDLIKKGEMPVWGKKGGHTLCGEREDDLFLHNIEDKELIPDKVKEIVTPWYEEKEDFMVLSPQHSGVCGINNINTELQAYLNPIVPGKSYYKVSPWLTINIGDRVINLKNNYKLGIFNGFVGIVLKIEYIGKALKGILIDFNGEKVFIKKPADIRNLALAYCVSVHKSQGSEYKKGIVILHSSHFFMLNRSLMYVAISRFKEELYVIGDTKGLNRALKNNTKDKRNTYLQQQQYQQG